MLNIILNYLLIVNLGVFTFSLYMAISEAILYAIRSAIYKRKIRKAENNAETVESP